MFMILDQDFRGVVLWVSFTAFTTLIWTIDATPPNIFRLVTIMQFTALACLVVVLVAMNISLFPGQKASPLVLFSWQADGQKFKVVMEAYSLFNTSCSSLIVLTATELRHRIRERRTNVLRLISVRILIQAWDYGGHAGRGPPQVSPPSDETSGATFVTVALPDHAVASP